jgi:hypothetical protein
MLNESVPTQFCDGVQIWWAKAAQKTNPIQGDMDLKSVAEICIGTHFHFRR